jgi:hypothetical protein
MRFQMGFTYLVCALHRLPNDVACSEHWVDGLGLRLYLVYLLRDTLPTSTSSAGVDFELCSQSSSGIIESDFSV